MLMADPNQPPDFKAIGEQQAAGFLDVVTLQKFKEVLRDAIAEGGTAATVVSLKAAVSTASFIVENLIEAEEQLGPQFGQLAALAIRDLLGVDVNPGDFQRRGQGGARVQAAERIGQKVLEALTRGPETLEPSDAGAKQYLTTVTQLALEGWLEGWMLEVLTSVFPLIDNIQQFGELDDTLAQVLGLGRMSRRVIGPLLTAKVITPFQWQVNKTYRPELLSAGDAVRQMVRGRWSNEKTREELARQGYSEDRIEALVNAQRKFFSAGDVRTFVDRGHWNATVGAQHLKDQGYDEDAAHDAIRLEGLRRLEQLEGQEASAIISAYATHDIDDREFHGLLRDHVKSPTEVALFEELARLRRGLYIKHLSASQAAACVRAGILAMVDYRQALRREGYTEDAVLSLELLLRAELDAEAKIAELRATAVVERAAEQQARDAEKATRRAAVEADRALTRRGAESDLENAAVRGLVPFARVEELYRAKYDADTIGVLVELLEERRQAYLAAQHGRDDAVRRGAQRAISVADLEAAVLRHVLTLDQYRAGLTAQGFNAADIDVLARTLETQVRDRDAARNTRDQAGADAARKGIDVARFERLVRRGVRTMAEYQALLDSLRFDEAAIAAMVELLELEIADDRATDQARQDAEARLAQKGLSLEQLRRLVVLELAPTSAYERLLATEGFTADAQVLLMNELRLAMADAEAARARRAQAPVPIDTRELPLTTVARAARLGLVAPATYADRLVRAGYSDDDVAIEMDLLLAEIADVQAARTARDETPTPTGDKELSLGEFARAVKRGLQSLEAFRARAVGLGLSKDAVDTQVRILGDELRETALAKTRRTAIDAELKDRNVSLAELEAAVIAGALSLDRFIEQLTLNGLTPEDAELLGAVLLDVLEVPPT